MNSMGRLLSDPSAVRLGWALAHFVWQGAATPTETVSRIERPSP